MNSIQTVPLPRNADDEPALIRFDDDPTTSFQNMRSYLFIFSSYDFVNYYFFRNHSNSIEFSTKKRSTTINVSCSEKKTDFINLSCSFLLEANLRVLLCKIETARYCIFSQYLLSIKYLNDFFILFLVHQPELIPLQVTT